VSEWVEVSLQDLCTRVTSGGTPDRSRDDYYTAASTGHPWVKSSELQDRYIRRTAETLTDLGLAESAAKLLPPESVLIAMYGATAGRVGFLEIEAAVNQAVCALIPDRERADGLFLFHALRHRYGELAGKAAGAAQQNLNAGVIRAFGLPVPDVATQRRIAAVLWAFDEIIEINERRIELLEELARSLYREWFVHLRFPGHEDIRVVESALGPLPEGWKAGTLDAIVHTLESGSRPRGGIEAQERSVPSVGAENVLGLGKYDYGKEKYISREFADGMRRGRVQDRDVLLYKDGAYIGRASMFRDGFPHDECYVNEHVFLIRTNHQYSQSLLYFWLADASNLQRVRSLNANAAQPGLNQARLRGLTLQIPSPEQVKALDDAAEPMLAALFALAKARVALARTRDLILPRLVTGRLDISDVDLGILTPTEVE
jgi:type I restriction enzyme S subunit